jgi:hypothetical protein
MDISKQTFQHTSSEFKSMPSRQQEKLLCIVIILFNPEDGGRSSEIQAKFYQITWCHIPSVLPVTQY